MNKHLFLLAYLLLTVHLLPAQKKPLDHTVYDGWQSIGERMISNDGKWVVYTINVQEGDNELVIQSSDAKYKKTVARGYQAVITEDSRFVVFKIRPLYKEIREARIKKKKPDEMPKDSFAVVEPGKDSVNKVAKVKSYKTPEKGFGWAAYHLEKKPEHEKPKQPATDTASKKIIDSLKRTIDSLMAIVTQPPPVMEKKKKKRDEEAIDNWQTVNLTHDSRLTTHELDADGDEAGTTTTPEGTDLVLRNLQTGEEKTFPLVSEYLFDKRGTKLLMETTRKAKDSLGKAAVVLLNLSDLKADTISYGGNDFKNFAFSDDGSQLAFVAERDAKPKELQKYYKLWYYKSRMDTAVMFADKNSVGMKIGMTVSEFGNVSFSKSGKRLFFGTAPIQPPKDTTLVDIDLVKLDIWHFKDDYLQTVQLNRLQRDLQENFLAVYDLEENTITQLGSREIPTIYPANEGDGETFVGVTDFGKRIESQWQGNTLKDIYAINVADGTKKLVVKDLHGFITPQYISPTGKYIMWYDRKARHYFAYDGEKTKNITARIKVPLWNEEYDNPDYPPPYGVMGWHEGDSAVYVYDRYDVWSIELKAGAIKNLTAAQGRKTKINYRYVQVNPEKRFFTSQDDILIRRFNERTKGGGLNIIWTYGIRGPFLNYIYTEEKYSIGQIRAAGNKDLDNIIYTKENFENSPDLYVAGMSRAFPGMGSDETKISYGDRKLSSLNPQQKDYLWGTAELFKWKAYNGKEVEGILYKPENFDPRKKYPLICYFYETLSDGLHQYQPPSPTPSRLNISFFVSRGYVVFAPDIHYGVGHPARDCYNHVVSGARALVKKGFIDSTRIGIQGQSWGGIQVVQLITMTNLFKAAWAGAPVANMTSAYGGIRWESGISRQWQYEKSQSRIGATLWQKPQLYIENSPLFHLPKVTTPLVIMHNDADGAVPWYQGIELFTAMRRFGKKVWMLNYNGEAHNLVERKNRKDIQTRQQQFFDWLLMDETPPKWITDGVPAVKKGKDWGLELD